MEKCSDFHPEIVHNENNCPLCKAVEEIAELEKTILGLETDVVNLKNKE